MGPQLERLSTDARTKSLTASILDIKLGGRVDE